MKLNNEEIYESAQLLLKNAGLNSNVQLISPIHHGGNNQLFIIKNDSQSFILKNYFYHPEDTRDRLSTEFAFLEFAYQKTPQFVPKPFSKNNSKSIALYEFIYGEKITSENEINSTHISAASQFISALNQTSSSHNQQLINASEACFSIADHLSAIDDRINELSTRSEPDEQLNLVLNRLKDQWLKIREVALSECRSHNISTQTLLPNEKRILSPSDFGFHNAIIQSNGSIKFIDFEYAGWDDPAKLVGDFFSQVAVPVNIKYVEEFITSCFNKSLFTELDFKRALILIDSYKIKWCCIVLNVFLSKNLSRRLFSNPNLNIRTLQILQLKKAQNILESFFK